MVGKLSIAEQRIMTNVLSFEEIVRKFDGEWVLIAHTELDSNLKPLAGDVIAHSIDRDVVYDALLHRGDRMFCPYS